MPRLQRVAILMSHASRTMGGATRDMILARAMRARGVDARMFRMHAGPETEREMLLDGSLPGVFCTVDNPGEIPHRQTSATLRAEIAAFAPDAVLYKGLGYAVNADVQAALPATTRIGLVIGGGVADPLVPRATLVLGEYNEQLQQHFPDLFKAKRGLVLPKYVNLEAIGPVRPVPQAEALYDIANVGTFGEKRKNQSALLPFADRHRVLCIGAGPLLQPIKREYAGNPRLTLPGRLPQPQVFAMLRQARIMVHTSTMDGLPRATVEGMACGLPVVALHKTITGGIPPAGGLLVSEAGLPHAVELLLADDALRIRMGRAARRYVERNHGTKAIEACAEAVIGLLSEA
ncbi:glycosyltransferase family 4 protein [Falsiroseomonas sp.]|uniref:glycosyltransferase family 4 protein n=1 Tax=Falsiroseomonas sp. TaxID=2870721 RepID=UPI0027267346|nr:glycosyltransferase family 4 protein [Falsiroseomonas sp.]MDO9499395.1 glycosyltransferase family 4 protein [Falsiroseomonas sp.]